MNSDEGLCAVASEDSEDGKRSEIFRTLTPALTPGDHMPPQHRPHGWRASGRRQDRLFYQSVDDSIDVRAPTPGDDANYPRGEDAATPLDLHAPREPVHRPIWGYWPHENSRAFYDQPLGADLELIRPGPELRSYTNRSENHRNGTFMTPDTLWRYWQRWIEHRWEACCYTIEREQKVCVTAIFYIPEGDLTFSLAVESQRLMVTLVYSGCICDTNQIYEFCARVRRPIADDTCRKLDISVHVLENVIATSQG